MPFGNPVSTAFCAQALALWNDHASGRMPVATQSTISPQSLI
jgi:hypothetical protein